MKTLLLILLCISLNAQEYNNWNFGNLSYLRFPGPVNVAGSMLNTSEGCASISDASGNLLFYTNGVTVWNRNHVVMVNGTGLFGENSTTQSAVIVKQPGNTNIYYIFTVPESISPNPHCYSIVDMNAAAGLGAVTAKNILIAPSSTEKLVVCKHRNNIDYWIITHEENNNTFRAVRLAAGGIIEWTTSNVGMVVTNPIGQMKISPNRDRLALCNYGQNRFCIYNFNNLTGVVSNEVILPCNVGPYGTEFSPDGSKVYLSYNNGSALHQYDICNNFNRVTIASNLGNFMGQFQLSPDGRIFIAQRNNQRLHIVNLPNNAGLACNFQLNAYLTNGIPTFGLPNNQVDCPIPILTNYSYSLSCGDFLGSSPNIDCAFNVLSYNWFVNNNLLSTNSTLNTQLNANTNYNITLRVVLQCDTIDLTQNIFVNSNGNSNLYSN